MGSKFNVPKMSFEDMARLYPGVTEGIQKLMWVAEDINRKHKCPEEADPDTECTLEGRREAIDHKLDLELAKLMMEMVGHFDPARQIAMVSDLMKRALRELVGENDESEQTEPNNEAIEQAALLFKRLGNDSKPH